MPVDLDALPERLRERIRPFGPSPDRRPAFVLYWMRTAVRAHENPALDVALALAAQLGVEAFVYHALSERYPYASDRHHTFILEGARDVARELRARSIGTAFHLERPGHRGPHLLTLAGAAGLVVTEDMPVEPLFGWTRALAERAEVPVLAVDTACVAPMRLTTPPKRAYAFRDAMEREWDVRVQERWKEQPDPERPFLPDLPFVPVDLTEAHVPDLVAECAIDHGVGPVPATPGGTRAGYARWHAFVAEGRLRRYDRTRNDPTQPNGVSRMSPYLHYGMVSPLRLAREAAADGSKGARKYLDELLTWRELAYAFCYHRPSHETLEAVPGWARQTLEAHRHDDREDLDHETLARGKTGDRLWDAAQRSLLSHGELHNNVRMTWGKALSRWAATPARALALTIDLNHRYALDGRDPASYGGILWCYGLFDRPFGETALLGRVRSRSTEAHARRFDLSRYERLVRRPSRSDPPRVAVVGAGVAGLACARTLVDHGIPVAVFDKGRRVGGRMATRQAGGGATFDHGAQYLTARDPRFRRAVEAWAHRGVLAPWSGPFARIAEDGITREEPASPRYVGSPRMRALPEHLAADLTVRTSVHVAPLDASEGGRWVLRSTDGDSLGTFDLVILTAPAPQTAALLPEEASTLRARVDAARLAPCWAVMATFGDRIEAAFTGARVADGGPLAWLAQDGARRGRGERATWVLHATPTWSEAHLDDEAEAVAAALVGAFRQRFDAPAPVQAVAHRWRYARTIEAVGEDCLFDPALGLGVAGDFCLGAKVEAAYLSGVALAGRVLGADLALPERQGDLFARAAAG